MDQPVNRSRWIGPVSWSIVALAFAGFIIIYGILNPEWDIPTVRSSGEAVLAVFVHFVLVSVTAIPLSLLVALLRWSSRSHWERTLSLLPWLMATLVLVLDWQYGQRILVGWEQHGSLKLQACRIEDIRALRDGECEPVMRGTYRLRGGAWLLEITDSTQAYIDHTGIRKSYPIRVMGACACDILDPTSRAAFGSARIIAVTEHYFDRVTCKDGDCYLDRFER